MSRKGNVVAGHHITMDISLAMWTVQAPDFHLSYKLLALGAFLGRVVLIHPNYNVIE